MATRLRSDVDAACASARWRRWSAPTRRTRTFASARRCSPRTAASSEGCNVENASYPAGIVRRARRGGRGGRARAARTSRRSCIATEADEPTPPCGICRQVLMEFAPELRGGERHARWRGSTLDACRICCPRPLPPRRWGADDGVRMTTDGVYVLSNRCQSDPSRRARRVSARSPLAACSEKLTGSLGCPELCTDQSAHAARHRRSPASSCVDTTVTGFPLPGTTRDFTLLSQGDTADVRVVVALRHAAATTFRPSERDRRQRDHARRQRDDHLRRRHAARQAPRRRSRSTRTTSTRRRPTRCRRRSCRCSARIGSSARRPSRRPTSRDTLALPLDNAACWRRSQAGTRLRVGLRIRGTSPDRLRIAGSGVLAAADVSGCRPTRTVTPDTVVRARRRRRRTTRRSPRCYATYPIIVSGALPPPPSERARGRRRRRRAHLPPLRRPVASCSIRCRSSARRSSLQQLPSRVHGAHRGHRHHPGESGARRRAGHGRLNLLLQLPRRRRRSSASTRCASCRKDAGLQEHRAGEPLPRLAQRRRGEQHPRDRPARQAGRRRRRRS